MNCMAKLAISWSLQAAILIIHTHANAGPTAALRYVAVADFEALFGLFTFSSNGIGWEAPPTNGQTSFGLRQLLMATFFAAISARCQRALPGGNYNCIFPREEGPNLQLTNDHCPQSTLHCLRWWSESPSRRDRLPFPCEYCATTGLVMG